LTKVVEKILAKDAGESLRKCVAKLELENSQLTTVIAESSKTIAKMQHSLDNGVEDYKDYNLLMVSNESPLAERNDLCHHTKDLESELTKVRAATAVDVTTLEAKIMFAEAHSVDVATAGENI
jgi:predicted  nucleic acid-binding Zn-ribbon protein